MIKIGITGSISSGKTTVSKILSKGKGTFFSADKVVKKLYSEIKFKKSLAKKLKFKYNNQFKKTLKKKILEKKKNLDKIEKIVHPFVREEMFNYLKKNINKKTSFFEIPLLIENKLTKYFDKIILIKSSKKVRLKRYISNGGDKKLFNLLNSKQLVESKKMRYCDHIIVNNKSLSILKKNILNILNKYE